MKLKRSIIKNTSAISAVIAASLLMLTSFMITGVALNVFLNTAEKHTSTFSLTIAVLVAPDNTLKIRAADPGADWGKYVVKFLGYGEEEIVPMTGGVTAGDEIRCSINAHSVYIRDKTSNRLVFSYKFPNTYATYPNDPPDPPSNPSPSDGETIGSETSATLQVQVTDPDGDAMDVSFYNANGDSLIGVANGVASGGAASVPWSGLAAGTTYNWYAIADDGEFTTQSGIWNFETRSNDDIEGWPMFRHDPEHSGYSSSEGPNTNNILWEWTTPSGEISGSSPVVADGKVYVGSTNGDNKVYCLYAENGTLKWSYETGCITSSPAVDDGKVYVCSFFSKIYCLDAETGYLIWETDRNSRYSPTVADGRVYFAQYSGKVICLDASNGNELWNYTTDSRTESSPAVYDGRVYIGSVGRYFYCLDAYAENDEDRVIWSFYAGYQAPFCHSSPTVPSDGRVYVGSSWHDGGHMYCFDTYAENDDDRVIWKYQTGEIECSPAVADGKVYFCDENGYYYCLDAYAENDEDRVIWRVLRIFSRYVSSPAVVDGKVYFGLNDDYNDINVNCLSIDDGTELWNYGSQDGNIQFYSPAIADGKLFISSNEGKVYCFGYGESQPPNLPNEPIPENNQTNVTLNPTLSVTVSDPNADSMTVSFYNADNDSLIGVDTDVESGTRASVSWSNLNYSTTYSWYVISDDGEFSTQSDTWEFKTIDQLDFGSSFIFNDQETGDNSIVALDDTHFVIACRERADEGYGIAMLGTISGDTVEFGNKVVFNDALTWHIATTKLDNTHVVITFTDQGRSKDGKAVIGTWNGEDGTAANLILGSPTVFNGGTTAFHQDITALDNVRVVISYGNKKASYAFDGNAIVGTWNGENNEMAEITFGSPVIFEEIVSTTGWVDWISSTTLDSDHVLISYFVNNVGGSGTELKAIVGIISGGSISFAEPAIYGKGWYINTVAIDSTHVVISYKDKNNSNDYGVARIATIEDDYSITFGSPVVFDEADVYWISMDILDQEHVLIGYMGDNKYGTAIVGEIIDDSIDFGSAVIFNDDFDNYFTSVAVLEDSDHFVIAFTNIPDDWSSVIVGEFR